MIKQGLGAVGAHNNRCNKTDLARWSDLFRKRGLQFSTRINLGAAKLSQAQKSKLKP